MEMSNSPLVTYTLLSPNRTCPRNHVIDTVTIHCFVGQVTAKRGCEVFQPVKKKASCNYVVGYDGSIGLCVNEGDRSWCTGGKLSVNGMTGKKNDHRAVTIEVACDPVHPYAVTDRAMEALLSLLADICKRNPGIGRLRWKDDKSLVGKVAEQNMTIHRWFAKKACPGDYLYKRHGEIAAEVNRRLDKKEEHEMTKSEVADLIEEVKPLVFGVLSDVPVWYRPTIKKLLERGIIVGASDCTPDSIEDNVLNVTEDFCRIMTTLDRAGLFDRKE